MFTYIILDNLPAVPDKFESIVDQLLVSEDVSPTQKVTQNDSRIISSPGMPPGYQSRELIINKEKIMSTQSMRFNMGEEWTQWAIKNIHQEAAEIPPGVAFTTGSKYHGAHCDGARNYILFYILNPGGKSVDTVFYREKGHPIFRPRTKLIDTYWVNDYDQLEEIERVSFPERTWILLNGRILHGVEGIETTRIAYQVGFNQNIYFTDNNANSI